ncbi:MAG: hypothetical protein KDA98_04040 [Acidimicrobiales bacterium]|nr:hypothetical protein [Acidimicrobiales bacterium]
MIPNLIYPLRRRWPILVALPILAVVVAILITPRAEKEPVRWTAGVYVAADPNEVNLVELQQASIDLKRPELAQQAAERLGEDPSDLKRFAAPLKISIREESLTLRLSKVDEDPEYASDYVTAFGEALVAQGIEERNGAYAEQLTALTEARDAATEAYEAFNLANAGTPQGVDQAVDARRQALAQRITEAERELADFQAVPVVEPYRLQDADETTRVAQSKIELPSSRGVRAVLALMMGVIFAIALAAFIERLNPRIDRPQDAERIVDAPVLAMVPIMKGKRRAMLDRAELTDFSGPFAESFRAMRSHLDFRSNAEGLDRPPSVMIVSSAPSEGKTTSAAFLALSYSEVGREVVVIGGDFRRPAIHKLFGVSREPGLSSRLLKNADGDGSQDMGSTIVKRDLKTGVRVVPSGPGTDRVTGLLEDLGTVTSAGLESGCTVVIDTAPLMVANDAIDYLPVVDWVIIVIRLGRTTERSLRQTVTSLRLNNANIAGCVMVGSLESSDAKRYYYSYYKVDEESEVLAQQQITEVRTGSSAPSDVADATAAPEAVGSLEPAPEVSESSESAPADGAGGREDASGGEGPPPA